MVNHYNFQLNLNHLRIIHQIYQDFIIQKPKNNKIFFIASKNKNYLTCYNNGNCLIQGSKIELELNFIKTNLRNSYSKQIFQTISNVIDRTYFFQEESFIGSDEVGTGDVFGPIVVCCVLVTQKDIPFLKKINIRDSKRLSKNYILKVAPFLIKKMPYFVEILFPKDYNILNKTNNLNQIKALLHNKVILNLNHKINQKVKVVVDQFVSAENYFRYLQKEKIVYHEVIFATQAESKYVSVSVASVIAKYFWFKEMEKLSQKVNFSLASGANHIVDKQVMAIYRSHGFIFFREIAKCNFINIRKYNYYKNINM